VSWSVLGHVLSEEQSKDGSDDGHLTIVQCHLYHWPPSSDLYRSSIGILPLLQYHQQTYILIISITNQHHVPSTTAQPEPHHTPHTFHVSDQSYCTCTSSRGHGSRSPQGLARIWVSILWHPSEYKSFGYMFHSKTICSPNYLLICSCLYLYKYSSLLYVFLLSSEFGRRCRVWSHARCWLQLVGWACSLNGCLEFQRSGWSRRVRSQSEKKLKKDESELRRSRLLSWYSN